MGYFRESRNIELSILYYLEVLLAADWPGVTLVKSFLDAYDKAVPVISVGISETAHTRKEIGSTSLFNNQIVDINIFAKSDGQRIDLSDYIIDKMKDGCNYYLHSHTSGTPTSLDRVQSGKIVCLEFIQNEHILFDEKDISIHDKYRQYIRVLVRKS